MVALVVMGQVAELAETRQIIIRVVPAIMIKVRNCQHSALAVYRMLH
jgi:hypothetical protein